ncbi:hypothetical protein DL96DRAFT_1595784 [Flagelloscypha sp. PMI_526]|nr:hypothetical protein DL96DRAFT_1595784 [Flagelloscypha sp. PMI_526]
MAPSVTCRVYQPRDQPGLVALFRRGMLGPGSGARFALKHTLRQSLTHYAGPAIAGSSLIAFISKSKTFQLIGVSTALLSIPAVAFYQGFVWNCFVQYMNGCLKTDMKDICKSYHLSRSNDESDEYAAVGPSGFWVALTDTGKVVGCEYTLTLLSKISSRPVALKPLFNALLEHTKQHKLEVESIELETTEFQAAAGNFYRRRGFQLEKQYFIKSRGLWGWVTFTLRLDYYRLWIRSSNDKIF